MRVIDCNISVLWVRDWIRTCYHDCLTLIRRILMDTLCLNHLNRCCHIALVFCNAIKILVRYVIYLYSYMISEICRKLTTYHVWLVASEKLFGPLSEFVASTKQTSSSTRACIWYPRWSYSVFLTAGFNQIKTRKNNYWNSEGSKLLIRLFIIIAVFA